MINSQLYNHPRVLQAETTFKEAYLNWVRTTVYAPVSGYVAKRSAQVGQQIVTNTPLLAVIPLNQIWVDANYKENQLNRLRIGQKVELTADANGFTYHGWVAGFSPGTGNAFAILPPQNATGNWIKIVQRLAVRIVMDSREVQKHPLQLGLSMKVTVHTRGLKGALLSTVPNNKPLYSTWIFNNQLSQADQEIRAILKANAPQSDISFIQLIIPRFVQGFGISCFFTPLIIVVISGLPQSRIASALGTANFLRILGGSFGTSISITLWDRRAQFHHSRLGESINPFNPVVIERIHLLPKLGFTAAKQALQQLDLMIYKEAYVLAINDIFWASGIIFLILLLILWFARPPFITGSK